MSRIFLGKIHLKWCDRCHVPVLGKTCYCGSAARDVQLTPPGDARPAFEGDIRFINSIYEDAFGAPLIPDGHVALLNKVPADDRMDEIIMGGAVVGAIRYSPDTRSWEALPRVEAGLYMKPAKRTITVSDDAIPFVLEGNSVLAPGVVSLDTAIRAGDEVFITDTTGRCIAVGRAKADAEEAKNMSRGNVARRRKNATSPCVPGEASWEEAVRANSGQLERSEEEAVSFIREVSERNSHLPATVSFSGGKDSLATMLLVYRAIGSVPLIFVDTGLEFPETYMNIEEIAERYGAEVIRLSGADDFRKKLREVGPPAVDMRWCCKVCKLNPVKHGIEDRWGECLSFIGQRKYESMRRKNTPRVWRNNNVLCQLSASPIQHWTALHVWLYIFREDAPYNSLYTRQLDRIGCFMCPSTDHGMLKIIMEEHRELWKGWESELERWREKKGFPEEWITEGGWRFRGGAIEEDSYN